MSALQDFILIYGLRPTRTHPQWRDVSSWDLTVAKIIWDQKHKHFVRLVESPKYISQGKFMVYRRWGMGKPQFYETTDEGGLKVRMSFPESAALGIWWKQVKVSRLMSAHLHVGHWQRDSVRAGFYFPRLHPFAWLAPGISRRNEQNNPEAAK